jgi:hypothetical protein
MIFYEADFVDLRFLVSDFEFYFRVRCVSSTTLGLGRNDGVLLTHVACAIVLMLIKLGIFIRRNRADSSELRVNRVLEIVALEFSLKNVH